MGGKPTLISKDALMENRYKMRIVDGKPVVECRSEEVVGPNGEKSVVIHAPSLGLVNRFMSEMKQQEASNG